jgi:hypothetical protein
MDNQKLDTLVNNIMKLFMERHNLKINDIDTAKTLISDIIIDFNRNCFSENFFWDYLIIFLQKINPNFSMYEKNGEDDTSIINYIEFLIVFLIILAKYLEDKFFLNRNFSYYYSIPIKRINNLEIFILKNINWDLSIKNHDQLSNVNT